jgi:hypothetical protein
VELVLAGHESFHLLLAVAPPESNLEPRCEEEGLRRALALGIASSEPPIRTNRARILIGSRQCSCRVKGVLDLVWTSEHRRLVKNAGGVEISRTRSE